MDVLRAINSAKTIVGGARVKHAVAGLNTRTDEDRCRALKYALCRFVMTIPVLNFVAEDLWDTFDVHFPCGIETRVVNGGEMTHSRGEMTRITNWAIKEIRITCSILKGLFYGRFYILFILGLLGFLLFCALF